MRRLLLPWTRIVALFLVVGLVGCNSLLGLDDDDDENEVTVTVQEVGADFLNADDGFRYEVTADTQYDDGFASLADVTVGALVEIEYADTGTPNVRTALEIEPDDGDDDD